jgi:peptide-methionine (S)-S-oxide reductase
MGQGNDRGSQYRSGFYYFDDEQKALIEASKAAYEAKLEQVLGEKCKITTETASVNAYEQRRSKIPKGHFCYPNHQ